ncbi:MAG: ABC transporter permease [Thermoproteota archaeon]
MSEARRYRALARRAARERVRAVREFLAVLFKKKTAVAGLSLIVLFAVLGGLADYITEYSYRDTAIAADFAVPSWAAAPDVPRNIKFYFKTFELLEKIGDDAVKVELKQLDEGVELTITGTGWASIVLASKEVLAYPYRPAKSMYLESRVAVTNATDKMAWYNVQFAIENIDLVKQGATLKLRDNITIPRGFYVFYDEVGQKIFTLQQYVDEPINKSVAATLPNPILNRIQPFVDLKTMEGLIEGVNAAKELILEKDTRLRVLVNVTYYCNPMDFLARCSEGAGIKVVVEPVYLFIKGDAHGILGTNYMGADVWSQFVYGARSAVVLGLAVSTAIVILGLAVGLVAGYRMGTTTDHVLTFVIDLVYFIPLLPMVMVVGIVFGRDLYIIYAVLIMLAWPGVARTVRHWTSTLRSSLYVEAAKAIGASDLWILTRHIAPQVIPYVVYSIVMSVPGVIAFEAGIQLIGFGDPEAPTWGRMISESYWGGGFLNNAWWWVMPPILGLIGISIGFALVGLALDEIVNPRLRR